MKISDLNHNPKNPRKITEEKLESLKESLLAFGDLGGVVFNRRTMRLVGGHQRTKLWQDSEIFIDKHYEPPTPIGTVSEGYILNNGERFSYREVDWDEQKEELANIAANKQGGQWDYPRLVEMIIELDTQNVPLELTGMDHKELEEMVTYEKDEVECTCSCLCKKCKK